MPRNRTFGHHLSKGIIFLAVIQAGIAFGAIYLATWLRLHGTPHLELYLVDLFPRAVVFTLGISLCLVAVGLYRHQLRGTIDQIILQVLVGVGLAAMALSIMYYVLPELYIGRGIMALASLLAFAGIAGTHVLFISVLDQETFKRRILFYGAGESALSLLERMQRKADRRLFRIVGCVPVPGETLHVTNEPILGLPDNDLVRLAHEHKIDEIIVVPDERRQSLPIEALLKLRLEGVRVSDAVSFYERYMGKLKTDLMNPAWIIFSEGFEQGWPRQVSKRLFDLLLALLVLLVSWPFMLMTVLAIWVEEGIRAPVLYRQTRVGLNSEPFQILKFRSMRVDAEADGKARWASTKDDRVTRVGAFLRKYRVDELPQLFNVFLGHMSLIGPRPERPEFVQELRRHISYYDLRHRVRPGVTGWAQLSYPYGATNRDALEKLQFDLYYVKNANLVLDLYILLGTVEVILLGKGGR
jgi:sugar transferase (PEP-CTERM system associated)